MNDFEIVRTTFFFIPHALYSITRYIRFRIFSASFLLTFLSFEIATSFNHTCSFTLLRIITSVLLLKNVSVNLHLWKVKVKINFAVEQSM